jgi:hypothetical protein
MAGPGDSGDKHADDELIRRLNELEWPTAPAGLADRSLEEFQRRLAQLARDQPDA